MAFKIQGRFFLFSMKIRHIHSFIQNLFQKRDALSRIKKIIQLSLFFSTNIKIFCKFLFTKK
jgi:hypothetical protein